jgi:hypothetical protein
MPFEHKIGDEKPHGICGEQSTKTNIADRGREACVPSYEAKT